MSAPRMTQLRPGIGVNIVLKVDQSSGKLTSGRIAEVLTKGDHPRGIKVRLGDGQVGRVQSLNANLQSPESESRDSPDNTVHPPPTYTSAGRKQKYRMQDDYRNDPTPMESRSLLDYVKVPRSSKLRSTAPTANEETIQEKLEKEFPNLDTALIAAIVADNDDVEAAKGILASLS
ncbi:hypothetical protein ACLMJK_005092 [Lecanora helva]